MQRMGGGQEKEVVIDRAHNNLIRNHPKHDCLTLCERSQQVLISINK